MTLCPQSFLEKTAKVIITDWFILGLFMSVPQEDLLVIVIAAHYGYNEGVTVLLNAGANVNIQKKFGTTALHKTMDSYLFQNFS